MDSGGSPQALLDDIEQPNSDSNAARSRRRCPALDREGATAINGGVKPGGKRKLAAIVMASVGTAVALLVTAVQLCKAPAGPHTPVDIHRDSADYWTLLAGARQLLPPAIHAELPEAALGAGRLLVIGDVHGCLAELRALLWQLRYQQGNDTVVLVGDLVDKGPDSLGVLAEAEKLGLLSVRGNHDDAALAAWEAYHHHGREPAQHRAWVKQLPESGARWLHALPWSLRVPSHGLTVVHAGLVPDVPLEKQHLADLYLMREVRNTSRGWEAEEAKCDDGKLGPAWASVWEGSSHVLFGHDHRRGLQEWNSATGLDTGCCYGERLTAAAFPPVKKEAAPTEAMSWAGSDLWWVDGFSLVSVQADKTYWEGDSCA